MSFPNFFNVSNLVLPTEPPPILLLFSFMLSMLLGLPPEMPFLVFCIVQVQTVKCINLKSPRLKDNSGICFLGPELPNSLRYPPVSFTYLYISYFHFSLQMNKIPSYMCVTFSLSIHRLTDISADFAWFYFLNWIFILYQTMGNDV